jgi:hypothetical protein
MSDGDHMEDPKEWKFKRNRNGDEHSDNCTDGYIQPKGRDPNVLEIHHLLCVHACSDETFPADMTEDDRTFIYACFAITEWNINGADNNIGLPRKWAFVKDPGNTTGWDKLPCHQVDHDRYLKAVNKWIQDNIWKKCKSAKKKEKCELLKGKALATMFNQGSDDWKTFLKDRGQEYEGTRRCLEYCLKGESNPVLEANWYVPFSMAPKGLVRKREKPPAKRKLKRTGLLKSIE